jgi:LCP family protein required for cell wall assembly
MKPTEIEPLDRQGRPGEPGPDRLTQLLIWAAFFLIAAVASLTTDLWLSPASDGPVVQAIEPTQAVLAPSATPLSAPSQTEPTDLPLAEVVTDTLLTPPACVPPDTWDIHIVQIGNTLSSLARRYGTDIDTLMYVNCLNTRTIFIGQRLYVPGPVASGIPPMEASSQASLPTSTPRPGASATPARQTASRATPVPTPAAKSPFHIDIPDDYLNILLLGSDKRPGSGAWRTDSMIVVSVDKVNNVVRLLSIPRDLWVDIPGHGYNRVNTAELWGELAKKGTGIERVEQTIYQNLGIPIHYYVRVDFQGFMKIINSVGGVTIDVDCPLPDINLAAGIQHMNGQQALRYARSRKSTNDFDRGRRQRKVLMALWDQALTMDIIPKLPELWRTMAGTFETDLPLSQVINLAYVGVHLKPQHIISKAIGPAQVQSWMTPAGAAVLLPREDKIRALLNSLYAPVQREKLDVVEKVRVRVLNGSQRNEAEQLAAAALHWAGFQVVGTGLADNRKVAQTQILLFSGEPAAAEELAQDLNLSASAIQDVSGSQNQPDPSNPVDIQVILGRDYNPCQR